MDETKVPWNLESFKFSLEGDKLKVNKILSPPCFIDIVWDTILYSVHFESIISVKIKHVETSISFLST